MLMRNSNIPNLGNGVKTYASFNPYWLSGTLKGTKYTIMAKALYIDDNGDLHSDTKTYDLTVYKPYIDSGVKVKTWEKVRVTGVYGYAECTKHYYDGISIRFECRISASNSTEKNWNAHGRFQHYINGELQGSKDQPYKALPSGGYYGSYPGSFSYAIPTESGRILKGDSYDSYAYIKLYVEGHDGLPFIQDSWDAGNTETFTHEDNK